ncbi:Transporter-like protein [Paenibacillus larvae]|nr:hypothetical protein BXP28_12475 [Paenibacillus larvae subsp. larvae]PCK69919.1 transporter-like protein [Paenibacillus larvae subsp. larvae B-3650]
MLDQGKPIEDSVRTMLDKAVFGALFAVIIILLFLRNIRTTLISIVSIPLSLLIAVLVLKQMDISLNIMTLGAMTVAIGRIVDDSIVVIENIYRRMSLTSERLKGKELILSATREMFMPIMSSTIVTIAVFLPLAAVSGPIGELFTPFALTIVFALMASLLVAITIVPKMGHAMFKNGIRKKTSEQEHDKPGRMAGFYQSVLKWALNHKWITFGAAILLLAYHATSIQEIVDTAGIAKGSLYFYFKSKEDLLLSLLKYYYDLLRSTINIISQDTHLSSRERLAKQMLAQFEFLTENKDFIMMLMHESSLYSNETFRQFGLWVQFPIRSMVLPKNCGYLWGRNKALWGRYGIYSECCDPAVFLVQYDF